MNVCHVKHHSPQNARFSPLKVHFRIQPKLTQITQKYTKGSPHSKLITTESPLRPFIFCLSAAGDEFPGSSQRKPIKLPSSVEKKENPLKLNYDEFDFDPSSIYCESCKYTRRKFFEQLGMVQYGYDVTCYLYTTSNINLPNFFKQSWWPKVWSKNANWIGYIAVSNDEMSKKLGQRDISIAWGGNVTRLEWIADLMDFLRPINSDKILCLDERVKVESE